MLNSSKSLALVEKGFSVPTWRRVDVFSWGGLQPVYVTQLPKSFIWDDLGTQLNPAFVEFFSRLGFNENVLRYERRGYRAWECLNRNCDIDTIYLPIVSCGVYHPRNSVKHASRCVARIFPRLEFMEKHGSDNLICLDLTTPHDEFFKENPSQTIALLRKAINDFLKQLRFELFPGKKSKLGGFYSIHPWKTTKPLDFHFHVHLQLFNVAFDGKDFYRFAPKLDTRKVRLAWRKSLAKFGLWDCPSLGLLPNVRLRFIKMSDKPRLVHRLRYIYRRPLEDLNKNLMIEDYNQAIDFSWAKWLIRYTPRQVFVGFTATLRRLGLICPKSFSLLCPICGQPMRKGDFFPDLPPDIPAYIQEKSNRWRLIL